MSEQAQIPSPQESDSDEIRWALETARSLWTSDALEALRWLRRAAETASDGGDDLRSVQLARAAADLRSAANIHGSLPPAASSPPAASLPPQPPPQPDAAAVSVEGEPVVAVNGSTSSTVTPMAAVSPAPVVAEVAPVLVSPESVEAPGWAAEAQPSPSIAEPSEEWATGLAGTTVEAEPPPLSAPEARAETTGVSSQLPALGSPPPPTPKNAPTPLQLNDASPLGAALPPLGSAPPPPNTAAVPLVVPTEAQANGPTVAAAQALAQLQSATATPLIGVGAPSAAGVKPPPLPVDFGAPPPPAPSVVSSPVAAAAGVAPQPAGDSPPTAAPQTEADSPLPSFVSHQALRVAFNPESDEFGQLLVRPLIEGEAPPAGWVTALLVGLDAGEVVLTGGS